MIKTASISGEELTFRASEHLLYGDPTTRFEEMVARVSVNLERRTDEQLIGDARHLPDPALREHALYQYLARNGADALPVIQEALFEDTGTFEVRFSEHAKLRLEYRRDMSTRGHVFLGRRRLPSRDAQDTVSMDAAFAF